MFKLLIIANLKYDLGEAFGRWPTRVEFLWTSPKVV